jgi:hypothetical protein
MRDMLQKEIPNSVSYEYEELSVMNFCFAVSAGAAGHLNDVSSKHR